MKFSLRNLLLANTFLAVCLSLTLADADKNLRKNMANLHQQQQLIEASKSFHLPLTKAELKANIEKYDFQEVAQR